MHFIRVNTFLLFLFPAGAWGWLMQPFSNWECFDKAQKTNEKAKHHAAFLIPSWLCHQQTQADETAGNQLHSLLGAQHSDVLKWTCPKIPHITGASPKCPALETGSVPGPRGIRASKSMVSPGAELHTRHLYRGWEADWGGVVRTAS